MDRPRLRVSAFPSQIDRYLLKLMFPRLVAALAVALAALLAERMLRLFDLMIAYGSEVTPVLRMVASLVPHYLGLALPVAFCIAVLGAMRHLSETSEAVAMENAGWSLRRIGLPFLACALMFCLLSQLLFGIVQPGSRYVYQTIRHELINAGWNGRVEEGTFFKVKDGLLVSTAGIDETGRVLDEVFVLREGKDGTTVMTANRGVLVPDQDNSRVLLQLNNGRLLLPEGRAFDFETTKVKHDFEFAPAFRSRGKSARELTTIELWQAMWDETDSKDPQFATEFHNRLIRSISFLGIAMMAIPLGMANVRNPGWVPLVVAIAILAVFDNAIKFVDGLAQNGRIDPAVGMWGLALIFNAIGLWLFLMTTSASWGPLATFKRSVRRLFDGVLRRKASE